MNLLAGNVPSASEGSASAQAIVPTLILLLIVAALIGVIAIIRRVMLKSEDDTSKDPMAGFSLGSLRQLVKEGKMTQEEYEKAKAQLVHSAHRQIDRQTPPAASPAAEHKLPPEGQI